MNKLIMALALYLGLGFFFGVNLVAIIHGASLLTAVSKGLVALALFALIGFVAGIAANPRSTAGHGLGDGVDLSVGRDGLE